ncbi:MAG: hypothetical protein IAX22_00510 [Candidatus Bathyarchaeota archaeon]|nr:hypothetical protein [Candidatus Bathyarchaeota archaeon]
MSAYSLQRIKLGKKSKIIKTLSPNDMGETGSHQAGILVPKFPPDIVSFFPSLDSSKKNPRKSISFVDKQNQAWYFNFIYYNGRFFGGTRDEYRLTSMTPFFKFYGLKSGDDLILEKESMNEKDNYFVDFLRFGGNHVNFEGSKLKLSGSWRIIPVTKGDHRCCKKRLK